MQQLALDVPVIDVHGYGAQLERREHSLDVLGAVEQVQPDVVAGSDPVRGEVVRKAVGSFVELGIREAPGGRCDRHLLADGVDDAFEQL
jgi:hypothetical protein